MDDMHIFKKHMYGYSILFFAVIVVLIWHAVFSLEPQKNLKVSFFNVGQGDAIFIETPSGNQMLIDGGPSDAILSKLGKVMPFWDKSIDAILLTHPDADHITGAVEALRRYDIGLILWTGVNHSSAIYREWLRLIEEEGAEIAIIHAGLRVNLGDNIFFDILFPQESQEGKSVKKVNNTSIAGKLTHGDTSFLLTGDAEKQVERRLVFEYGNLLHSDILKAGHHGSKTSSEQEFLRAVSPDVVVIQAGRKNRFGHPHQEVLERISAAGAALFRNDISGNIVIESDGVRYIVKD